MNGDKTLGEALELFEKRNQVIFDKRPVSEDQRDFLKCHDVAHVVFGCDTSLAGEGKVKLWTIFGTTLGFVEHIKGYSEVNAYSLFKLYSTSHILSNSARLLYVMPITIFRAQSMSKKWEWEDHGRYMNVPLEEIRREHNIRVV